MRIETLREKLKRINPELNIVTYSGQSLENHLHMCSVQFRKKHLHSIKQTGNIPLFPREDYGVIDPDTGAFVRRLSVWGLLMKLVEQRLITREDARSVVRL